MKEKFNEWVLKSKNLTAEQLKEKSAEELAALYNEYNDLQRTAIQKAMDEKASKEDIENLKKELLEGKEEQMKALNETLKQQGLAIKKILTGEQKNGSVKTIKELLTEQKESLVELKEKNPKNKHMSVEIKVAGDMLLSTNVSGGNVPVEQRIPGMNAVASRQIRLLDLVNRGTAESNVISWVYQANKDGAAGGTAEGETKNQIDFDLVVESESVKKRTAFIKVSTEMLDDVSYMESEIRNELLRELLKDVEGQVYEGDGLTTNLNGIKTVATPFSAGVHAGTVDNANIADVLVAAMDQIEISEQGMPTAVLMYPSDLNSLKMKKVGSTDERYIDRLQNIAGQMFIDGIPIIKSTLVTQDEFLIGNFELATVYDKGEISIEIGLDGNDFTKNMRTVLAEWRGLVIVKNNDRTAFVTGDFTTAKAALETA